MRFVRMAMVVAAVVFVGMTDADAGKRSRRVCCPVPVCQTVCPAAPTCPQPTAGCNVCTPMATCCTPPSTCVSMVQIQSYYAAEGEICPQFCVMSWGSYCSYYAVICNAGSQAVMLDAACGLPQSPCTPQNPVSDPNCSSGSYSLIRGGEGPFKHSHHSKAGKEPRQQKNRTHDEALEIKSDPSILEIVALDADVVGRVGYFQVKDQGNTNKTVYVQLRRFSITPQPGQKYEGLTAILKTGQQIDKPAEGSNVPEVDLDAMGKIEFNNGQNKHVVYVTLGGNEYQVIMAEPVKQP